LLNLFCIALLGGVNSLEEIETTYKTIEGLGVKLASVREESSRHSQVTGINSYKYQLWFLLSCRQRQLEFVGALIDRVAANFHENV
jgi:hypothetical protein